MTKKPEKLAILVLNWNGADLLGDCLDSLRAQTYGNFQVVVVDNHSSDDSRAILEKQTKLFGKKLHVIYHHKNAGFAGGVNIGIAYATRHDFDGVALFNNDAVADKNWLKELASSLDTHPNAGIATGLLLYEDGKTIENAGECYSIWGLAFPRDRHKNTNQAPVSDYVFGASGGASLYRISLFKDIGLFDESFFAYFEDVDISFRAQLAGHKVYYQKQAVAYHKEGQTSQKISGLTTYHLFKNLPILLGKNIPLPFMGIIGPRFVLAYKLMFWHTLKKGTFGYALKGLIVSLWLLPHTLVSRRATQRRISVSLKYIDSIFYHDLPPQQPGLKKFLRFFKAY